MTGLGQVCDRFRQIQKKFRVLCGRGWDKFQTGLGFCLGQVQGFVRVLSRP